MLVAGCAAGTRCGDSARQPDPAPGSAVHGSAVHGSAAHGSAAHGSAVRVPALTAIWRPAPRTTWQWQPKGNIDDTLSVQMYDVDLFDAPDAVLTGLRKRGVKIVCYFSA